MNSEIFQQVFGLQREELNKQFARLELLANLHERLTGQNPLKVRYIFAKLNFPPLVQYKKNSISYFLLSHPLSLSCKPKDAKRKCEEETSQRKRRATNGKVLKKRISLRPTEIEVELIPLLSPPHGCLEEKSVPVFVDVMKKTSLVRCKCFDERDFFIERSKEGGRKGQEYFFFLLFILFLFGISRSFFFPFGTLNCIAFAFAFADR